MGAVYLAHRADGQFQQTVAVKIMAAHLVEGDFLRKFHSERQLLASLNHPNITRLLDGGVSTSGTPYLVMEYVDGKPLDVYCDTLKLDVDQRLRLFLQICEAVDYAHRNMVVHRDLKPANILVTSDGTIKLLDFGTASFTAAVNVEQTVASARSLTPRYASPEQLRGDRANLSNDIYSLGVILYELLTGAYPFGDPSSVAIGMARAYGTTKPGFPATKISRDTAKLRGTQVRRLKKQISGDLTAIVLKALEYEPGRRYVSVRQFAQDIERRRKGLPVEARPSTIRYRSGKFFRRHWLSTSAAIVFVLGLCSATFVALHEARVARARYSDLRSITTTLLFELKDAITDVPGSTPAQKILVTRVMRSLDRMLEQSGGDSTLRLDVAEAYRQLGELQGDPYGQNLGDSTGALASLSKAMGLAKAELTLSPSDPGALRTAAHVEQTIGEVYFGMGDAKTAIAHLSTSTELFDRLISQTTAVDDFDATAAAHGVLGDIEGQPGTASLRESAAAAKQYRRAIEIDNSVLAKDARHARAWRGIAIFRMKLGDLVSFTDPETALVEYRQALESFDAMPAEEKTKSANGRIRAFFLRKAGTALSELQQWNESADLLDKAFAVHQAALDVDPTDSRAIYDLAVVADDIYGLEESRNNYVQALAKAELIVTLFDHLIRTEPDNPQWRLLHAYSVLRLEKTRSLAGGTISIATESKALAELGAIADKPDAPSRSLELAADAFATAEPPAMRDTHRAVRYAERFRRLSPAGDPQALYQLALTLDAADMHAEASATARQALAFLAAPKNGRVSWSRMKLEEIAGKAPL